MKSEASYHHGNLRDALIDAVEDQLSERGPEGVSLRAAAKTVGVSSPAVFRHFADKRAVMTAIAVRAHEGMIAQMTNSLAEANQSGTSRRLALAQAYVAFAMDHSARFEVMFRSGVLDEEDDALKQVSGRLTQVLVRNDDASFDASAMQAAQQLPHTTDNTVVREELEPKQLLEWAVVHGLASLATGGALATEEDAKTRALVFSALDLFAEMR